MPPTARSSGRSQLPLRNWPAQIDHSSCWTSGVVSSHTPPMPAGVARHLSKLPAMLSPAVPENQPRVPLDWFCVVLEFGLSLGVVLGVVLGEGETDVDGDSDDGVGDVVVGVGLVEVL